jgi:hypothetical protein
VRITQPPSPHMAIDEASFTTFVIEKLGFLQHLSHA